MYGLEDCFRLATQLSGSFAALLGYVGLGGGPELIPYFFALLSFVGAALIAVLQWPVAILLRYLRRRPGEQNGTAMTAPVTHEAEQDAQRNLAEQDGLPRPSTSAASEGDRR